MLPVESYPSRRPCYNRTEIYTPDAFDAIVRATSSWDPETLGTLAFLLCPDLTEEAPANHHGEDYDWDVWGLPAPMFHLTSHTVFSHFGINGLSCLDAQPEGCLFPPWAVAAFAHVVGRLCQRMDPGRSSALRKSVMQGWDAPHIAIFDQFFDDFTRNGIAVQCATRSGNNSGQPKKYKIEAATETLECHVCHEPIQIDTIMFGECRDYTGSTVRHIHCLSNEIAVSLLPGTAAGSGGLLSAEVCTADELLAPIVSWLPSFDGRAVSMASRRQVATAIETIASGQALPTDLHDLAAEPIFAPAPQFMQGQIQHGVALAREACARGQAVFDEDMQE